MKIIGPMAGIGTRLRPFTYSKPKGFLKVAGKRVIDHILNLFQEISQEKTSLAIVTGFQDRSIKEYLIDKYSAHFHLSFIKQQPKSFIGDIPYFGGLGEAIYLCEKWYSENITSYDSEDPDDFCVIFLSDMIPLDGFHGIISKLEGLNQENPQKGNLADDFKDDDYHIKSQKKKTISLQMNNPKLDGILGVMQVPTERTSSYGILETDENSGLIIQCYEKPDEFISNTAISGVYVFKPAAMRKLFENLKKEVNLSKKEDREAQFTPAIQNLIDEGFNIGIFEFQKGILDFGKPDTLLEGNRFLLEKMQSVLGGPVESITESCLTAPSFIGKNTQISNCVIGPFCSIGDNCILNNCILKNTVIGDGCILENIITSNSIIGDYVVMDDLIKEKMIIGDRSNIRSSD